MSWKDGYVAEIEYVRSFQRGLSPSSLNFVLMMNGFAPLPLQEGFSYCELGCGHGDAVNLLAACHPEGSFHGVDFNPDHIANVRDLARKAGLKNVTFWEVDFADLAGLPLPEFDFIALHGVYSWVSAERRHDLVEFMRLRLKAGGVVYNGYNCLPGWAAHAPLRHLLLSYAQRQSGTLLERMDRSVEFVEQLKELNLAYFDRHPLSAELFDTVRTLPRNYLAHEFFNLNWTPFYHADVAEEFTRADLSFACSARFSEFKESLRFPAPVVRLLSTISDPVLRETVKDYAANQQFRSDVFTRSRPRLSGTEQMAHLLGYRFALAVPREAAALEVSFPAGTKQLLPELYDPILGALEEGPLPLEELSHRVQTAGFGSAEVIEALIVLCAAEYALPAVEPSPEAAAAASSYNLAILEEALGLPERRFLASAQLSSGVPVSWLHLLLLWCEVAQIEDPLAFVRKQMQVNDYTLTRNGTLLHTEEETLAELRLTAENFRTQLLPVMRKLGVL